LRIRGPGRLNTGRGSPDGGGSLASAASETPDPPIKANRLTPVQTHTGKGGCVKQSRGALRH
jgi:hypothetical protein